MKLILMAIIGLLSLSAAYAGECRALIVSGDPGLDSASAERFTDWNKRWAVLLKDVYGFKAENIATLRSPAKPVSDEVDPFYEKAPRKPPVELLQVDSKELASRDNVLAALDKLVKASADDDQVLLVWIGHEYDSQERSLFCLPGKDITDVDVAGALKTLKCKTLICINTAPSSSIWAKSLAAKNHVIITATGTPDMRSETYFCEFILRALKEKKNLTDAFNGAAMETIRFYQNQFVPKGSVVVHGKEFQEIFKRMCPERKMVPGDDNPREANNDMANMNAWLGRRMLSEIAALEDNGDGEVSTVYEDNKVPTPLPSAKSGDGTFAKTVVLGQP